MKITVAILTLLFAFIANAQVPERDLRCEEDVLQTAKAEVQEVSAATDKLYEQSTTLSNFRGGEISIYNTETKANRYEVQVVVQATRGRKTTEYSATMTVDETCKKVEPGSYLQTSLTAIPEKK
jgi:hypothetical protein